MADKKITSYPKEKVNILFLENISDAAVKRFSGAGYTSVKKLTKALSEADLMKEIEDVHLLGIRSKTQVTEKVLRSAKKLQAIGCFCIGVNQVDLKNATKQGIAVFNAPYSNTRSVAELVIGASIMLIRRIPDKSKFAHEGIWMKESKGSYELRGKTMGIIGYGNIGTQVSILAESMGMKVVYYDIESISDIITIHVPDTNQTRLMINKTVIKQIKKGAILLNYARGEVVDLEALARALEEGNLSGAGVDVYPLEPEKNGDKFVTPLQNLSNVLLTPHIGGSTEEAQVNIGDDVSNKLFQYLEMGITTGSHTIPELSLPQHPDTHRILHIHYNVPGVLSEINTKLSNHHINILAQYLKTNDDIGYVVLDVDKKLSAQALSLLKEVKNTIKVRLLY